jgi:hypothetical protein
MTGFSCDSASAYTAENSSYAEVSSFLGYSPETAVVTFPIAVEAMPLIQL